MKMNPDITLHAGLEADQLSEAVLLYDQAFAAKFSLAIPNTETRRAFFLSSFSTRNCLIAKCNGEIVGVLGYQLQGESFTGGATGRGIGWRHLRKYLGFFDSLRACLIFALFARQPENGTLLLDGIAVKEGYRGAGIGQMLLREVLTMAEKTGCRAVRLDVIETNPRAKALYEKMGFQVQATHHFPYLKWILGFAKSFTMIHKFSDVAD